MTDPNFERAVILLLDRGPEGALGVVLNRPTGVPVDQILEHWSEQVALVPPGIVFRGGPVARDAVIGLARAGQGEADEPGWRPLFDDVGTVDLALPPSKLSFTLRGARLFSGYSGWSSGQLEQEIDEGAWFVVDALSGDAFVSDPERQWHDVLRRQSGRLSMLAAYPPSPLVN